MKNKKEILEYSVFILETFQVGYCHKICIFGLTAEYTPSRGNLEPLDKGRL